ncbi:MAG: META domain-containing protein, partial [Acidimicrobiia bacterium]
PTGIAWELVSGSVDGTEIPIVDGHPITLSFTDDTAGGTAACNGYGGSFAISGGDITFSQLGSTEMACMPDTVMTSEIAYLEALPRLEELSMTENELILRGEGVELIYTALPLVPIAELTGTVWVLDTLVQGDSVTSVTGERATLELFTDGSMLGSTGCRTLNGDYSASGAELVMTEMSAHGECPAALEGQDNHVVAVLGDGFHVAIEGETLSLAASEERGLTYRSES